MICIKSHQVCIGLWRAFPCDLHIFNLTEDVNSKPNWFNYVNQKSTSIFRSKLSVLGIKFVTVTKLDLHFEDHLFKTHWNNMKNLHFYFRTRVNPLHALRTNHSPTRFSPSPPFNAITHHSPPTIALAPPNRLYWKGSPSS